MDEWMDGSRDIAGGLTHEGQYQYGRYFFFLRATFSRPWIHHEESCSFVVLNLRHVFHGPAVMRTGPCSLLVVFTFMPYSYGRGSGTTGSCQGRNTARRDGVIEW